MISFVVSAVVGFFVVLLLLDALGGVVDYIIEHRVGFAWAAAGVVALVWKLG